VTAADLLQRLVALPSVSGQEQAIADHVQALLEGWGAQVRRQGNNLWTEVGQGGPRLLLNSHLDTVPVCDGWTEAPHAPVWRDGRLVGLGANDAKGCVAAMLMAFRELLLVPPTEGTVVLALTAEEETGGQGLATILPHLGPLDAAVVGEPTGLAVCAAQRGMLLLKVTTKGEAAHVAHAHLGANAIHAAAQDIAKLAGLRFEPHPLLGEARPQVTQVEGGRARNQVPDACTFFVDLRTTPNLDHGALAATFAAELAGHVHVHSARYLPKATDPAHPIVRAALQAAGKASPIGSATTSDWAFLGDVPAVKLGPGDTHRSHRPDEWITHAELEAGVACFRALVPAYFARAAQGVAHA
jgi:acetylornithine deacetylase